MQRRRAAPPRHAFTILELMIATVLMAVLLAGTWALLGIYQGQFEKSQDRVERWQLIRSLQNQLTDDLSACHVSSDELALDATMAFGGRRLGEPRPSADTVSSDSREASPDDVEPPMTSSDPVAVDENKTNDSRYSDAKTDVLLEWMSPAVGLEGSKNVLIIDSLAPTHPPDALHRTRPRRSDQVTRVVYSFVDPVTAAVEGRPAGLVRCQWRSQELRTLFATNAGNVDLYALLHQIKSPSRSAPSSDLTTNVRSSAASKLASLGFETVDIRHLEKDVVQRIDVLPELTSLLFSYYDGQQWHSSWSFSQRRQLPVAVELRFDLASRSTQSATRIDSTSDPSQAAQRLLRDRDEASVALERSVDNPVRSTQSVAPVGYRWLIFLGRNDGGQIQTHLEQETFASRD